MEFNKLKQEMEEHRQSRNIQIHTDFEECCEMLKMGEINTNTIYYRGVRNNPIKNEDFATTYKESNRPYRKAPTTPIEFCLFHGVSVFNSKSSFIEKALKKIQPHYKPGTQGRIQYICEFKFQDSNAGLISKTKGHHKTFYKSDQFDVNLLHVLSIEGV